MPDTEETTPVQARSPLAERTVAFAREKIGEALLEVIDYRGETTLIIAPDAIVTLCQALHDAPDLRYDFLADLTAVDWPDREPRYDIVYHLMSIKTRAVIRLKARIGMDEEPPAIPTVSGIWKSANWSEREVHDLFGIEFIGHPDLQRILMPNDWIGHPLRKDYPLTGITLPDPHWGGQVPYGQPLPPGTGQQTLRTPGGVPGSLDVLESEEQTIAGEKEQPE
jgi:NADH-quinone oxidoreductase subunit C